VVARIQAPPGDATILGMTMVARHLTALTAAHLFDGTSGQLLDNALVLVDGSRIIAVDHGVEPPDGASVVDFGDATLLPGLIDTHVHLCFDATADPVASLASRDDEQARSAAEAAARAATAGGVTTVRDLGDRDYLTLDLPHGDGMPTVLSAGPPLTTEDGHCHFLGGVCGRGIDAVRTAVREHVERGVHVIKVMASGGLMTPNSRQEHAQFDVSELRAIVDEGHRHGLAVVAHAHGTQAVEAALDAGVDGLEHVTFWSATGVDSPDDLIERIATSRVVVGTSAGFAPAPGYHPDGELTDRLPAIVANMRKLHDAGAHLLAGTDGGINPMKPHDVLRFAVPEMAFVALTPLQSLLAATSEAASVCGLAHRKGRLAAGYDADIVAVGGNPLTDPTNLHDLRAVYVRGVRVATAKQAGT
jgi:imidazolonepropionase-like amidohydrolase